MKFPSDAAFCQEVGSLQASTAAVASVYSLASHFFEVARGGSWGGQRGGQSRMTDVGMDRISEWVVRVNLGTGGALRGMRD